MSDVVYIGAFLDVDSVWKLLAMFPPQHEKIYADHCTLCFRPTEDELDYWCLFLGDEVEVVVKGEVYDSRGHAVLVDNLKSKNKYPHVTVSTAGRTSPAYSNRMLEVEPEDDASWWGTQPVVLRAVIDTFPRGAVYDTKKENGHG